jgi:hypothetical protein
MLNEAFGWLWILLGLATGVGLGIGFGRDDFLGGYASWPRRLLRLGHISFFGLGLLNILFAFTAPRIGAAPTWVSAASWALIVGGVTMPACCALAAWRRALIPLFALPVLALLFGATVVTVGTVRP